MQRLLYNPVSFRVAEKDIKTVAGSLVSNLGCLVSNGAIDNDYPLLSHLPLVYKPDEGRYGTIYGHFARANPHARHLQEHTRVLVVMSGESAYISPNYYASKVSESGKVVPTWNYSTLHLRGTYGAIDDAEGTLRVLNDLTDYHESKRFQPPATSSPAPESASCPSVASSTASTSTSPNTPVHPWKVSDAPPEYVSKLLRAIVAFRIEIESAEGKVKMSQNKSVADVTGVMEGIAQYDGSGTEGVIRRLHQVLLEKEEEKLTE